MYRLVLFEIPQFLSSRANHKELHVNLDQTKTRAHSFVIGSFTHQEAWYNGGSMQYMPLGQFMWYFATLNWAHSSAH